MQLRHICCSHSNIHGLARIFKRQDLFSYALLPMHGISMVCCRQKLAKIFRLVNFSGFSSKNWNKSGTRVYKGISNGLRYNSSKQELLNLCNYCLCVPMWSQSNRWRAFREVARLKLWTSGLKWNGLKHENKQAESSTDLK